MLTRLTVPFRAEKVVMEVNGRVTGAGEVRRVNVVYFLSHGGQTEQPHFFRVHHASRAGVFLRDVKRWLADLRGKDMPDGFAWSYKRKYRSGYIWQDLVDDDLLTPISDNQYVILGSSKLSSYDSSASEASPMKKKQSTKSPEEEEPESPELQSPQSSILTDDESNPSLIDSNSFRFGLLKKKNKAEVERCRRSDSDSTIVLPAATAAAAAAASGAFRWPSAGNSEFPKRKSFSGGRSHVFRNLITCGAVETKDAILVVLSRRPGSRTESPTAKYGQHQEDAARKSSSRSNTWNDKNDKQRDYSQKAIPAAYKPASRPNCSQCGKPFKPEKMHKHMKSCSGMKSAAVTRKSFLPEKECSRKPMDVRVFHQRSSSIFA